MSKTLIQLVNDVGKNLRRSTGSTYTTLDQDFDAVLITQFLNMAKDMVEGEAQWDVLIGDVEFTSAVDTQTYDLSDDVGVLTSGTAANERSQLVTAASGHVNAYDITDPNELRMRRRTRDWVETQLALSPDVDEAYPVNFAFYPQGAGMTVAFPYPIRQTRNYRFQLYTPQEELTTTTDVLSVPWRPVVMAATALACEERGEELGMTASTWWEQYNRALSEAIVINSFSAREATMYAT